MSVNVVLQLKRRPIKGSITIPSAALVKTLQSGNRDALWAMFRDIESTPSGTHDKVWLQSIVNWAPEGGLPLKDMSKWLGLVSRVEMLDDSKEGPFTLNPFQDGLLWGRLNDPAFKLNAMSPLFAEFLLEYLIASGHHFAEVTEGMWDDNDS